MCDYQGHEFGAKEYPDSICIDGFLFDADSDYKVLSDDDEQIPCPKCNSGYRHYCMCGATTKSTVLLTQADLTPRHKREARGKDAGKGSEIRNE